MITPDLELIKDMTETAEVKPKNRAACGHLKRVVIWFDAWINTPPAKNSLIGTRIRDTWQGIRVFFSKKHSPDNCCKFCSGGWCNSPRWEKCPHSLCESYILGVGCERAI